MHEDNAVCGTQTPCCAATPLAAVAPLTATPSGQSATLTWTAIAGASGYNIYRCTTPGGEAGNVLAAAWTGSPTTGYTDSTVASGQTYYYKVTGEYGAGTAYSGESTLADCAEAALVPIISSASASPNPVTGTTAVLSASAVDYPGGPGLSAYTWSQISGPAQATFSSGNGTMSGDSVTATFSKAGSYTFQVLVADGGGASATSDVPVTVDQTPTGVAVSPAPAIVGHGQQIQLSANVTDQFGAQIPDSPAAAWSVASGGVGGTITQAGLYSAPASSGSDTVNATIGSQVGTGTVNVEPSIASVDLDAQSASSGYSGTGTVTLAGPSVGASTVTIASDDSSVSVAATATFADNAQTATFAYSLVAPAQAQTGVTVTGSYYGTQASTYIAVYPAIDLSASATGVNMITLFWPTITGAVGYDIYRSVDGGMTYSLLAGNAGVPDTNPTISPYDEYADSGLLTGSPYYYYIAAVNSAGTEFALSGYCTATPSATAIPWDTGNASDVISAVYAEAAANVTNDAPEVGVLFVLGPDGTMYSGNYPDGTPAHAEPAPAYADWNAGQIVYSDGETEPLPSDTNGYPQDLATSTLPPPGSPTDSVYKTDYAYLPEHGRSGGPFRKVESQPGFLGLSSVLFLPAPIVNDKPSAALSSGLNLVSPTTGQTTGSGVDSADIYTGGGVAFLNSKGQYALDHYGNYIERSALDVGLSCGHDGSSWKPFISEINAPVTALLGSIADGEIVDANHPDIEVNWETPVLLEFAAPGFEQINAGFILNLAGQITATYMSSTGAIVGEPVSAATLFYAMSGKEDGWSAGNYDIIKRANSIAQDCKSNDTLERDQSWVYNAVWGDPAGLTNYDQDALLLKNGSYPVWASSSADHLYCSLDGSYPAPVFGIPGNITYDELVPVSQENGIEIQATAGSFQ